MQRKSIAAIVMGVMCFGAFFGQTARAQELTTVDREYKLKAAFLYQFTNYVDWPSGAFSDGGTLLIGILGKDSFGASLNALEKKTVKGRRLVVKRSSTVEDLRSCQIVFVSASEGQRMAQIAAGLKGSNALLVGELDGFAQKWGMINFVSDGNKVRFEVNLEAAKRAGLQLSGRLLKVAKIVSDQHS
jgi:hypothetical protein